MKHSKNAFLGVVLISGSLVSGVSFAEGHTKGTVVDGNGNLIRSVLSGECVRTQWDIGIDECASMQTAKPVHRAVVPEAKKSEKKMAKEHKRSYITFFDFNRSVLTDAAKDIIRNLFNDTKSAESAQFKLTGHADRVGSDDYNLMLSKKRAMSVKNELMRLGVSGSDISVKWKGESEPLVPTKDGIAEPQNRRTEIKFITKE